MIPRLPCIIVTVILSCISGVNLGFFNHLKHVMMMIAILRVLVLRHCAAAATGIIHSVDQSNRVECALTVVSATRVSSMRTRLIYGVGCWIII